MIMGKKNMKSLLTIVMSVFMILVLAPKAMAAETEIGNSETKEGADAYTLTIGQEYITTLNGVEGYVSFVTPEQEGFVLVALENRTISGTLPYDIIDAAGEEVGLGPYSISKGDYWSLQFKSEKNNANGAQLAPNTRYYIQLGATDSQPNGKVGVSVKFSADDCPEGRTGAKEISPNVTYTGKLDAMKLTDKDWYVVTATKSGQHRIFFKSISRLEEINLQVYDEYNQWIQDMSRSWAHATVKTWGKELDTIDIMLEAGKKYYLEVTGGKGEYSINVNCQTIETINIESTVTMKHGETHDLKYTLFPEETFNQQLEFESNNKDVAYVDNDGTVRADDAGKAVITVKAKDGGGATAQCIVYVKPQAPDDLEGTKSTTDTIKLKWSSAKNATGYNIFQKKDGKWKKIGSTKKTTYTVKKLKHTKGYQFRVQAYMKLDGKIFTSEKSKTSYYATRPKATTITKITRMKPRKIEGIPCYFAKVQWKKVAGVKKYRLYAKLASTGKIELVGEYKSTSAKVVLMYGSGSKKCTFYVAPVFKYHGEEYEGPGSKGKVYTFK